jgi:hypothetical protein
MPLAGVFIALVAIKLIAKSEYFYSTSLAKSANRDRSPRASVMCPPCGQPLNLSTA